MKTTFFLRLCGEDESLLKGIASEAFHLIGELEQKLSRYAEGGDIHRINALQAGETHHISEESHACLLTALEAYIHTGGLFDPTLGSLIDHQKQQQAGEVPRPLGQLIIHPDTPAVTCVEPGRIIDLGGIGKGFALDQLARFIDGWDIDGALFSSGASTHLAVGDVSWPIELVGDQYQSHTMLHQQALSASSFDIQGCHIVHPGSAGMAITEVSPEKNPHKRIWAYSQAAAFADAWSTALMLMPTAEIAQTPTTENQLTAVHLEQADGLHLISAQA
ncbi:FAD:protein FMN transferase [Oceaniferula marina]|nr:FAD:protein FMN transferase [Oceaniferula marina]